MQNSCYSYQKYTDLDRHIVLSVYMLLKLLALNSDVLRWVSIIMVILHLRTLGSSEVKQLAKVTTLESTS